MLSHAPFLYSAYQNCTGALEGEGTNELMITASAYIREEMSCYPHTRQCDQPWIRVN
nr:MAG TPA: hypothetical protein [Bacteriophage sp.]DAJ19476.1 MAG TPA: hypothetical protein [Podoviridae sp. ctgHy19]